VDSQSGPEQLACVADRENGRIQCFSIPYGYFKFQIRLEQFNGRVFSVAYDKVSRTLYAVAGPSLWQPKKTDVLAFAFNPDTQQLKAMFAPNSGSFSMPHDMAVSNSGNSVFVVEIGPNNIWMFNRADMPSSAKSSYDYLSASSISQSSLAPLPPNHNSIQYPPKSAPIGSVLKSEIFSDPGNTNLAQQSANGRQLRNSISFNSMLFIVLLCLFLFIIILHYRYSSRHYSIISFSSNMFRTIFARRRANSRPVYNSSLAERIDLAHLFETNKRRNRKFEKKGFNRLPQNETDVVDAVDDDEDDLSDVIEDFSPKGSSAKTRLV